MYLSCAYLDFNKLLSQEMHKKHNSGYIEVSFIINPPHTPATHTQKY